MIIRALIIYFVSSFLRKPSAPTTEPVATDTPGAPPVSKIAAMNFFSNGTLFDLHCYISEDELSVNFTDPHSLVWFQEGLTYGDWYSGRNGDGTVTHHTKIRASERLQVSFQSI